MNPFPGSAPIEWEQGHSTEPTRCALFAYSEWGKPVDFSIPELTKWIQGVWAKVQDGKHIESIGTLDQAYAAIKAHKNGWEGSLWETWAPGDNAYTVS